MKDWIGKAPIPPLLFYPGKIAGYVCWLILLLLLLGMNVIDVQSGRALQLISYFLFMTGSVLIVISLIDLGSSVRFGLPTDSTNFKSKGIYRYSRNPMYVGFHFLTFASIIYTLQINIIILGIFSLVSYHFIILAEEKFLKDRFGRDYISYKQGVRRYI